MSAAQHTGIDADRQTLDVIPVPEFTLSASRCSRLHLNAVAKRILPEHTRDALFQLFCDARTNTPKDQVFFMRHAEALKPHTFTGWLVSPVSLHATCKDTSLEFLKDPVLCRPCWQHCCIRPQDSHCSLWVLWGSWQQWLSPASSLP